MRDSHAQCVRLGMSALVQHKMAKNLRMALCFQNQGTNQRYGFHSSANISVHSASVTVLRLTEEELV